MFFLVAYDISVSIMSYFVLLIRPFIDIDTNVVWLCFPKHFAFGSTT